jgi:hypothetical protein
MPRHSEGRDSECRNARRATAGTGRRRVLRVPRSSSADTVAVGGQRGCAPERRHVPSSLGVELEHRWGARQVGLLRPVCPHAEDVRTTIDVLCEGDEPPVGGERPRDLQARIVRVARITNRSTRSPSSGLTRQTRCFRSSPDPLREPRRGGTLGAWQVRRRAGGACGGRGRARRRRPPRSWRACRRRRCLRQPSRSRRWRAR